MSITEVIGLGIKGQNIVLSTLKKVEDAKKKAAEFATMDLSGFSKKEAELIKKLSSVKGASLSQELQAEINKVNKENIESRNENFGRANNVLQSSASLNSVALMRSISDASEAIPYVGQVLKGASSAIITAAVAYKEQVIHASQIVANTEETRSRASNLIAGGGGSNFVGRVDMDLNSRRTLVEALGNKYGIVQKPLQDAIQSLYHTAGKNEPPTDIYQAQQLATGNFSALGTDKGWFMQKISDQFSDLPPSMRQALQVQMLKSVTDKDKFRQNDVSARSAQTILDNMQRAQAQNLMQTPEGGTNPIELATRIMGIENKTEAALNQGANEALTKIGEFGASIKGAAEAIDRMTKAVDRFVRDNMHSRQYNEWNQPNSKGTPSGR